MRSSTHTASNRTGSGPSPSTRKVTRTSERAGDPPKDDASVPKRRNKQSRSRRGRLAKPAAGHSASVYEADRDKIRKAANTDNYAGIQTFFAARRIVNDATTRAKVDEAVKVVREHYAGIRREYDEMVLAEEANQCTAWKFAEEWPVFPKKNLMKENRARFVKLRSPTVMEKKKRGNEVKALVYLKPVSDEHGNSLAKISVYVKKVDAGVFNPPMTHWVSIQQSINTDDLLKLTHMPYFSNVQDDREMYAKLSALFPDGIHGFACNWSYINNWLAYKVCRSVLEEYRGEPDILYYALYCLWPNKFSQREFSQMFPRLCNLYAEDGYECATREPWKKDAGDEKIAENLKTYDCYACLSHLCPRHGFSKQSSSEYPKGDFSVVRLPLPSDNNDRQRCSETCWKTIDRRRILEILTPNDEEIAVGRARVVVEKERLNRMGDEEGAMIAELFMKDDCSETFCEFVKNNVYPESEDEIKTCRDVYLLIAKLGEFVAPRRLLIGRPSALKPKQERVQNFRKLLFRTEPRKSQEELEKLAETTGRPLKDVEEEEDRRVAKKATMEPNKQFIACRHLGPCGPNSPDCSCGENRICSTLCQCDINCKQRFPGCNCAQGQCQSNKCQCYYGNWECNPLTCKECRCDSPEAENACKNFAMTKMAQKRMHVAPSKIAGNGLFLLQSAEKDELITEYVGERISDDEAERRGAIYDRYHCSYIFNLNTGGAIDSYKIGNLSRFANHEAKNPSMVAKTKVVAGEHRIGFYAKRKLEASDELTFDYGYFGEHRIALKHVTSPVKKARRGSPPTSADAEAGF